MDDKKIDVLSPEVIGKQATINIGTIGHVAHGKSTLVRSLSGVHTVKFKAEMERNITIKLGYANAKIYKCDTCVKPGCYAAFGSDKPNVIECTNEINGKRCEGKMTIQRHISFVDCPGHDILMATMLNGAAVMDGALLMIASNEVCPQPQTMEHLAAVEIMKLRNIIILQNKIDLISREKAMEQYKVIKEFVSGTNAANSPIIPISAQMRINIDVLCEYICNYIPIPTRNLEQPLRMMVVRSFDVNKPGTKYKELLGGVAGGSIIEGVLRVGDEVEIRPGVVMRNNESGQYMCRPYITVVTSLHSEKNELGYAIPGGLIGVGTKLDPDVCKGDKLIGQVLGHVGKLPEVYNQIEIKFQLMKRLIGCKMEISEEKETEKTTVKEKKETEKKETEKITIKEKKEKGNKKETKEEEKENLVDKTMEEKKINKKGMRVVMIEKDEKLMINIGSVTVIGIVSGVKENMCRMVLNTPVCTNIGERIAISRNIQSHWRLIGWGEITKGKTIEIKY